MGPLRGRGRHAAEAGGPVTLWGWVTLADSTQCFWPGTSGLCEAPLRERLSREQAGGGTDVPVH